MATRGPGMPGSRHPTRHVIPSTNTTPPRHRLIYSYNSLQFLSLCCHGNRQTYPHPLSARHRLIYCHNRARFTTVIIALLWQPPDLTHPLSARGGCYTDKFYPLINSYNSPHHSVILITLSWKPPDTTYISKTVQYYGVPLFHSRAKHVLCILLFSPCFTGLITLMSSQPPKTSYLIT